MRFAKALFALSLIVQSVQPVAAADVPRKSPEFAVLMPNGGQLLLSNYRGKVVCLHFITAPRVSNRSLWLSMREPRRWYPNL
jgi:hypothetical protein